MFLVISASIEHIKAGKLRALAVTSAARLKRCRMSRLWASLCRATSSSVWFGVGAPKNTPAEIVDQLNKEINAGLADPSYKSAARLTWRITVFAGSPADFGKLIAEETEKWGKVSSSPARSPNEAIPNIP